MTANAITLSPTEAMEDEVFDSSLVFRLKNKSTFNYIYKRIFVKFNYFPLGFMSFFLFILRGFISEGAVGVAYAISFIF